MSGQNPQDEEMQEFCTQLSEIHSAVVGNKRLGHKGLVTRMEEAEQKLSDHDRHFIVYATGAIVGSAVVGFVLKLLRIL